MKSILLDLGHIEVSIAYTPIYRDVVEADTPLGPIIRQCMYDIEILDIKAIDRDDNIRDMAEIDLYNHITHADLLLEVANDDV